MARRSKPRHYTAQLQHAGITLLGLGVALLVMSFVMGSTSGPLRTVSQSLRSPMTFLLALGAVLAILGWALSPKTKPTAGAQREREPEWVSGKSADFVRSTRMEPGFDGTSIRSIHVPAERWSKQVFDDIEWRRFEALCSELFAQAGFEPRSQSHGADGGVDIWLHSRNADGPVAVVQCKHWHGKQVGVKEMREFYGVMASRKVTRGTYATTSTFTDEATRFAKENGIHLLDGEGLLWLIAKRTPEQQSALLEQAYEGEYWRPTCASCGRKMVERNPRKGGKPFWGCSVYPKCRSTLPMREPSPA